VTTQGRGCARKRDLWLSPLKGEREENYKKKLIEEKYMTEGVFPNMFWWMMIFF